MEPPEAIREAQRTAPDHLTLRVETVALAEASRTGGVDRCRVVARAEAIHRGGVGLRPGDPLVLRLPCWDAARMADEPPGPARIYHGLGAEPARVEVWGEHRDDTFAVWAFVELSERTSAPKEDTNAAVDSIGTASMSPAGAVTLQLRADSDGALGDALLEYLPDDPDYDAIIRHLDGIRPGEQKPVPPFPPEVRGVPPA